MPTDVPNLPKEVYRTERSISDKLTDRSTQDFENTTETYKYAKNKPKFAQRVLEEAHAFGPVYDVMDTLHTANKGRRLDGLEKFYIYKETQRGNQINDKLTVQSKPIFQALLRNTP